MILSPLSRLGLIVAAVAAFGLVCWLKGAAHAERKMEQFRVAEEKANLEHVIRLAKIKNEVHVVWMDRVKEVEGKARTIIKRVPEYVTKEASDKCTIPVGFVRLWNDRGDLQADLYQPASGVNDPARGVALDRVAGQVAEAKRRFELNKAKILTCQDYLRKLETPNGP